MTLTEENNLSCEQLIELIHSLQEQLEYAQKQVDACGEEGSWDEGYDDGLKDGKRIGYAEGYDAGYEEGREASYG